MIKLWDTATGEERYTLEGLTAPAFCVAFAPDGRTLVSGGGKVLLNAGLTGEVKIWRGASDEEMAAWQNEAVARAMRPFQTQDAAGVLLSRIPREVTDNGNGLVRRHHSRLTFNPAPKPPGFQPAALVDGNVEWAAWPPAPGGDASQGQKPWFEVAFPEVITVRRVTVLGSRYAGNGLRAATLELYDAGGKLLQSRQSQGMGDYHDCDWRFETPVEGVTKVRFVVEAEQEGDHPAVAIAEFLAE